MWQYIILYRGGYQFPEALLYLQHRLFIIMIPHNLNPEEKIRFIKSLAMDNAAEGITIADVRQPDCPLIFVNRGFCEMTGYTEEYLLGKNCRFLQGPQTVVKDIDTIRKGISEHTYVQEEILNYRKDGTSFWNRLSITPVFEGEELIYFIGIQEDITVKKEKEALDKELADCKLVLRTTLKAEQRQRQETGEELHDNINQLLAAAKMYLTLAVNKETDRMPMLEKGKAILGDAMEEIRILSKKLTGPDNRVPLQKSLSDLIGSISIAAPFAINFTFEASADTMLTAYRKQAMYRIIQEQFNNIIKHAQCSEVAIAVFHDDNLVYLSVKDNGKGFLPDEAGSGIGLKNMNSRAEAEGSMFTIKNLKEGGCEVMVKFPLSTAV